MVRIKLNRYFFVSKPKRTLNSSMKVIFLILMTLLIYLVLLSSTKSTFVLHIFLKIYLLNAQVYKYSSLNKITLFTQISIFIDKQYLKILIIKCYPKIIHQTFAFVQPIQTATYLLELLWKRVLNQSPKTALSKSCDHFKIVQHSFAKTD